MRIAVVGGGIAGLGAAHILSRAHEVTVFEREQSAGGHANTVHYDGLALDTGFLVHNERTYPLLGRLFTELGVTTQDGEMSFSVSCSECGLEYSGRRPFAQPRNAVSPRFLSLLWEIARWLRTAGTALDRGDFAHASLGDFLDANGYSQRFRSHFLVPLTAALWSTAPGQALDVPAAATIAFFENHGMLGFGRFRWRTVTGGSRTYVDAIGERLGAGLRTGEPARSISRDADGITIRTAGSAGERFDAVVVATHADEALALLEDPSAAERSTLGRFGYSLNETILHTDTSLLPRRISARASWNYRTGDDGRATLTYYLNKLQRLETDRDYCVTLNQEVAPEHVLERFSYTHPLFTVDTPAAQEALRRLSGERRTFYAGAHLGNGFHEDGLAAGVAAARALGVNW